jgi:hypothetical protein
MSTPKKKPSLGDVFTMLGHALNNPDQVKAGAKQATKKMFHELIEDVFTEKPKRKKS